MQKHWKQWLKIAICLNIETSLWSAKISQKVVLTFLASFKYLYWWLKFTFSQGSSLACRLESIFVLCKFCKLIWLNFQNLGSDSCLPSSAEAWQLLICEPCICRSSTCYDENNTDLPQPSGNSQESPPNSFSSSLPCFVHEGAREHFRWINRIFASSNLSSSLRSTIL